jgi:hypothetical protein
VQPCLGAAATLWEMTERVRLMDAAAQCMHNCMREAVSGGHMTAVLQCCWS